VPTSCHRSGGLRSVGPRSERRSINELWPLHVYHAVGCDCLRDFARSPNVGLEHTLTRIDCFSLWAVCWSVCHGGNTSWTDLLQIPATGYRPAIRRQATARMASTWRSQTSTRFQLVKFWLTIPNKRLAAFRSEHRRYRQTLATYAACPRCSPRAPLRALARSQQERRGPNGVEMRVELSDRSVAKGGGICLTECSRRAVDSDWR
jgi:hypothetical protein